jgi:polar amino acid transport system substrate-binding protein
MLSANEYKVVVSQLPVADMYSNLLKAIAEETNNTFNIEIVPFSRLGYLIENNLVDICGPLISPKSQIKQNNLKYDLSTSTILEMVFVLYTNKNINIDELKKGNPKKYYIETEIAHINLFDFECYPSTNIEGSLKKVDIGKIDGYIFAQGSTDMVLKKGDYKNIKRLYYDTFQLKFAIKKGTKGGEIDKILTNGINKIKDNGKYEKIIGAYAKKVKIFDNSF